ncbi:MAG: S1 family peptidase [Bosea sp. (in: a-proteobacteria)]
MGVSFGFRQISMAVTLAALPLPAQAIVGGQTGGPLEASAVMVLHDRGGVCTGSVLAPDVILTAAHCVPSGAQIRVHYREQGQPVLLEPQSVVRHPEYRANAVKERMRSIDMALIKLRAPLPGRFENVSLASTPAGSNITVAGFGLSREGDASTTGTWRSARLQLTEPFGPSRILLWAKGAAGIGACQGDSGGPVIGAGNTVVAVTSWSTGRGGRCGDLTQGVLVSAQRGWIDNTLQRWSRQADWR